MEDHLETTKFTESIWERNFSSDLDVIDYISTLDKNDFVEFSNHISNPTLCKSIIADMVMASDRRLTVDATVYLISTGVDFRRGTIQIVPNKTLTSFKRLPFSMN